MGLDGFCFAAIDSRSGTPTFLGLSLVTWVFMGAVLPPWIPHLAPQTSWLGLGTQRDDSGPSVGNMGLDGLCFAAIDSRSGTLNIPLGLNGMTLPPVGDMGLHGFCFAAIDSRSGTPNIPLGLNGLSLGLSLATWVFMGSVLRASIPDLARPQFWAQCWRRGSSWVLFCHHGFHTWHLKHPG